MSLELLGRLKERGIRIWAEEGRLLFNAPKGALTPELRDELKRRKGELLEFLSQDGAPPIERVPRDGAPALSFAQERLWFLDQLEPGNAWYNILSPIQLDGDLDCAALQTALRAIVQRHEVLRSSFPVVNDRPVQQIRPRLDIPLPLIDLGGLGPSDRQSEQSRLIRAEVNRPFDLSRGPLIRAALVVLEGGFAVGSSRWEGRREAGDGRREESESGFSVSSLRPSAPCSAPSAVISPLPSSRLPAPASRLPLPSSCLLLLNLHHIVSDGWSSGILIRELAALYSAYADKSDKSDQSDQSDMSDFGLPPLPIQYADFAHWQRRWLSGRVLARQIGHWKQQLQGAPQLLDLPVARPRPRLQSYRGFREPVEFDEQTAQALRQLARREGATLFMVLLGLFATLLARYSGQKDVLLGSPIANRNRAEIEPLIGFFVNTLVLRTRFEGRPGFRRLLGQVRETTLGAYAHQDLPFEKLVEELQPRRDVSHTPLFQVLFTLQNAPSPVLEVPGLRLGFITPQKSSVGFDLDLTLRDRPGAISGTLAAAVDLFDRTTIRRLIVHLQALARSAIESPGCGVFDLPLLGEAERRQILLEWNDSDFRFGWGDSFSRRFLDQSNRTPDACAVGFENQALSYAELRRRSAALAARLGNRGVGPDSVVALLDHRRPELLTAILAVLQAGAAYLPLDPNYPAQRLALVLQQSRTPLAVASFPLLNLLNQALEHLPTGDSPEILEILCLEEALASANCELDSRLPTAPSSLAYVIFTSGSTGLPKGAMVHRRGFVNHLDDLIDLLQLSADDVVAQTASQSFDISVWQFTAALLVGSRVEIFPDRTAHDPVRLLEELGNRRVSLLQSVPSLMQHLLEECSGDRPGLRRGLEGLRWMIPTGEALPPALCRHWLEQFPSLPLLNAYGPAECSDDVTLEVIRQPPTQEVSSLPVGRPVANLRIHLLDESLQPVPIGIPGEICVAGLGVGRGYLQDPRRTAQAFLPDPFADLWGDPGGRLYRTGDLASRLPDGNIEFLGRLDFQVKVRGFRIELGEIEAVLASHPSVQEAAVVVRGERLAAYVVGRQGEGRNRRERGGRAQRGAEKPSPRSLRLLSAPSAVQSPDLQSYLKAHLPAYMLPSAIVTLDSFPHTPNGKLDRKALPEPEWESVSEYVAPRTPTEEMVAGVWSEVLNREQVGVEDNFFDLGGHSLMATQVLSRLRQALQVELSLQQLFEAPTVAALSQAVETAQLSESPLQAPPIRPVPRDEPLPLSFAQQRLWFLDQLEPGSAAYNILSAERLEGLLDVGLLESSLNLLTDRHEVLRTTFAARKGSPEQVIAERLHVPLPLIDLRPVPRQVRHRQARCLTRNEAGRPFDLSRGPLIRAALLRLEDEQWVILLSLHHTISDDWSIGILFDELNATYSRLNSHPLPDLGPWTLDLGLPPLPIHYADYAVWQRNWLQGEVLEHQLSYCRGQFKDVPEGLNLPTDRPRPALQSYRGAYLPVVLPETLSQAVERLGRRQGTTLFMTLMAAFSALLSRWSGQDDVLVGYPVAGRNRRELEGLIGFFVNTLVLRTDLSGDPTFGDLLGQVRQSALQAYGYQELPFERLVEELQLKRDLSRNPLFQVMFMMQNAPSPREEASALTARRQEVEAVTSKFDLTLSLEMAAGRLRGSLIYCRDLFDRTTMLRLLRHFEQLLESACADPSGIVSDLPLLSPAESQQLLYECNDAQAPDLGQATVVSRFKDRARQSPHRVAIVFGDQSLSYSNLGRRSELLAAELQQRGLSPESLAAIFFERSVEMIIALLGILRSGAAYLPLDPIYPAPRIASILEEARPNLLLTQSRLLEDLPGWTLSSPHPSKSSLCPPCLCGASSLAYVIYTSGSTGRPKGVQITHRALTNFLESMRLVPGLDARDVLLAVTTISFDIAALELFLPLVAGARLALASRDDVLDGGRFLDLLTRSSATVMQGTPATWRLLLAAGWKGTPHLKVLCGGEALPADLASQILQKADTLWNMYGPTETTIWSGTGRVQDPRSKVQSPKPLRVSLEPAASSLQPPASSPASPHSETLDFGRWTLDSSSPLGPPIRNTTLHILDRHCRPLPLGVAGELHIGGDGLARGYFRRPELSAEKFIPDPLSAVPGERLYRTGDLARRRRDGLIDFLDRIDFQVKIRGFRIELGEIESVLSEAPGVRQCAVTLRQSGNEKNLAAYFIPETGAAPGPAALRNHLRTRLPEYMIPAFFVSLDAFPLTSNGKLDRKALPAPDSKPAAFAAPRNELEKKIAAIWKEILPVEQVGRDQNFFDLGGHSLLVVKVQSRLQEALQKPVTTLDLFRHPTVAALSEALSKSEGLQAIPVRSPERSTAQTDRRRLQQRRRLLGLDSAEKPHFG